MKISIVRSSYRLLNLSQWVIQVNAFDPGAHAQHMHIRTELMVMDSHHQTFSSQFYTGQSKFDHTNLLYIINENQWGLQ